MMTRSAAVATPTVEPAVLSCGLGSSVSVVALATSVSDVSVELAGTCTTTVTVAVVPFASVPSWQSTVPLACVQLPALGVAETKVTPGGSASLTCTLAAAFGPLLRTVMVEVACWPAITGSGVVAFVNARSAFAATSVCAGLVT